MTKTLRLTAAQAGTEEDTVVLRADLQETGPDHASTEARHLRAGA